MKATPIPRPVKEKFDSYPKHVRKKIVQLRDIILNLANDLQLGDLEESLKWGEPSYLVKGGSAVRFDWKPNAPEQYALYFNCNTKLVETFKELYGQSLTFEKNRAIVLDLELPIPQREIKHCIELSFKYHKLKKLALLGA